MNKYLFAVVLWICGCDAPELYVIDDHVEVDASTNVYDAAAVIDNDASCNTCTSAGTCVTSTSSYACGRGGATCVACPDPTEVECHVATCSLNGSCAVVAKPEGARCSSGDGVCLGGQCQACGTIQGPCCAQESCNAGLICRDNLCRTCGRRPYYACVGGVCTDGSEANPITGMCECGGSNQICCTTPVGIPPCRSGLPCGATGRCA